MNDLARSVGANLRRARLERGLSLAQVAAMAELSRTTLTNLEAGTANPTVETVWALSQALDLNLGALIDPDPEQRPVVVRRGEQATLSGLVMDVRLLAQPRGMSSIDLLDVTIRGGDPQRSDGHAHGTVEHIVVRSGRVRVGPVSGPVDLEPGDYVTFRGDGAHLYEALSDRAEMLVVICYPATMVGLPDPGARPSGS